MDQYKLLSEGTGGVAPAGDEPATLRRVRCIIMMTELAEWTKNSDTPLYACWLNDVVPTTSLGVRRQPGPREVVVNPTLRLADALSFFARYPQLAPTCDTAPHLALISDQRTHIEFTYWLRTSSLRLVEQLRPGAPPPTLDASEEDQLLAAGILVQEGAGLDDAVMSWRARFAEDRFVVLQGLLPPAQTVALARFYRQARLCGAIQTVAGRMALTALDQSEPLLLHHQLQLQPLFERIIGSAIEASPPYLGLYERGANLPRHTDLEGLDFTAALLIDQSPQPFPTNSWPLYLETERGPLAITLGAGDCILYSGRELAHYCHAFAGELSISHFYHFARGIERTA